jgi:hypothetical protein
MIEVVINLHRYKGKKRRGAHLSPGLVYDFMVAGCPLQVPVKSNVERAITLLAEAILNPSEPLVQARALVQQ